MEQATKFIDYLWNKSQRIPEDIYERAKDCLMDYLAVTFAGAENNYDRWTHYLEHVPSGKVRIFGYDVFSDGKTAALINGFNAHSLELDDGQRFAMIHLGGSIISALMSAEAECDINKKNVLTGIVMGYETACRLSISMQPSHKKRGFHTAGTCGTVGAALGVAFALGMNKIQMQTVLAAAVTSASGLLEIQEQASELKPYNIGMAAMDGLSAAYMGFTDFMAPDDILNGERGFMRLFCSDVDVLKLTEDQDYFEIERIYVKPYAACRHCHSAIEAALILRNQVELEQIDSIRIETYQLAVKGHDHKIVNSVSSAKLSMPYSVAAAIVLGDAGINAFSSELLISEKIISLMDKISVFINGEYTQLSSQKRIANVIIRKIDGSEISYRVDYAKGDPENPMTRNEIINKAKALNEETYAKIMTYAYG